MCLSEEHRELESDEFIDPSLTVWVARVKPAPCRSQVLLSLQQRILGVIGITGVM